MVWVVVLLTVLPWGVRAPDAPTAGHEPGAPEQPMLPKKFLITTLIAALIWGIIYVVIDQNWISFRANVDPFVKPGSSPFARAPALRTYCDTAPDNQIHAPGTEERRVGKDGSHTSRYRVSPYT